MARAAAEPRELEELEGPKPEQTGLRLIGPLEEDSVVDSPMTWRAILSEWASRNIDSYRTRPRDGWWFHLPDDPKREEAFAVPEITGMALQFNVDMKAPWQDTERNRWLMEFFVRLCPVEMNTEDQPLKSFQMLTRPDGITEPVWTQKGAPRNANREYGVIDVIDDQGLKTRKSIPRYTLKPELTRAMTNVLLVRCANTFVREIKRSCLARGIDFAPMTAPVPKPSGDLSRAVEDHGLFQCYVQ